MSEAYLHLASIGYTEGLETYHEHYENAAHITNVCRVKCLCLIFSQVWIKHFPRLRTRHDGTETVFELIVYLDVTLTPDPVSLSVSFIRDYRGTIVPCIGPMVFENRWVPKEQLVGLYSRKS